MTNCSHVFAGPQPEASAGALHLPSCTPHCTTTHLPYLLPFPLLCILCTQMSVMGYSRAGSLKPVLAPSASSLLEFHKGDKVVVVADLVT